MVIQSHVKLSYKNDFMIVRGDEVKMIHLSEINTVIIDSTQVSLTSYLLCEFVKRKIKVIFCDEKRNPNSELVPYYGAYNSSKKIKKQIAWNEEYAQGVWTQIVCQKILNQANLLKKYEFDSYEKLSGYVREMEFFDSTNREGHAAKVYFNSLFGKGFSRDDMSSVNAALNYGYGILLSNFNKEIVADGYLTQLGIKHTNEYNPFNLTCDLMEPFRVLVDEIVYNNIEKTFDKDFKLLLVDVLNRKVMYCGREYYLTNAIQIYLDKIFDAIEHESFDTSILYEFA